MKELLQLCTETSEWLPKNGRPILRQIQKDRKLKNRLEQIEEQLDVASEVHRPAFSPPSPNYLNRTLKAVAWNLERGKQFDAIVDTLKNHSELRDADLYFFTEVDWGMLRSGNRSVAADLGKRLDRYAYFAPSYFNLTLGHGGERYLTGKNEVGLHGKAILSRFPLTNLRTSPMPNATNKLRSVESRLGQKRSLIGDLVSNGVRLSIGCIHLDAFSSPLARTLQMEKALQNFCTSPQGLIAGDWNTNTIDSRSGHRVLWSVLKQLLLVGPRHMLQTHHPHPHLRFERPLFTLLEELGFDFEKFNEMGIGTFDLLHNDREVGAMARDQMPAWIVASVNRLIKRFSNQLSLKLDWFAGKNLKPITTKVIRLNPNIVPNSTLRPSDHHPIALEFKRL